MGKFNLKKGDKINARTSAVLDDNYKKVIAGHNAYGKTLTVSKTFDHGVRTQEAGYIHNNNILGRAE